MDINKKEKTSTEELAKQQASDIWESWITDVTDYDDVYIKDLVDEESN